MCPDFSALFYRDPYCRKFSARLEAIVDLGRQQGLILSQTCFYPEGGGQPGDRGTLSFPAAGASAEQDTIITGCCYYHGQIAHLCEKTVTSERLGSSVDGALDWERRYELMQQHSAEHILSGLCHERFGYDNIGFGISEKAMTLDFNGPLTSEALSQLEVSANQVIWKNLPIVEKIYEPGTSPQENYRYKKSMDGAIRLIAIEGVDCCACCGTHCRSTAELGPLKIVAAESHRQGVRLTVLAGIRALRCFQDEHRVLQDASVRLSSPRLAVSSAIVQILDKLNELKRDNGALTELLFNTALDDDTPMAPKGNWRFFEGFSVVQVKQYCKLAADRCAGIHMALLSEDKINHAGGTPEYKQEVSCLFFACSRDRDLSALLGRVRNDLQARGGGQSGFIQGSLSAEKQKIEAVLREAGLNQQKDLRLAKCGSFAKR